MNDIRRSAPQQFGLASAAMKGLTLSIVATGIIAGATVAAGCAPRINATHYERWASQDTKRKVEAEEEAKKEAAAALGAKAPAKVVVVQPVTASPPPPPPGEAYNSLSGDTPPVKTATKSRVMKPAEEDDIY